MSSGIVDLSLPKWDIDTSIDLSDPLPELGIEIPGGDYSGIAPGLFLGQAVHGANITVDEQGTEAAAGTGLGFEGSGPPPPDATFRADRPKRALPASSCLPGPTRRPLRPPLGVPGDHGYDDGSWVTA